ncbi:peptidase U62 modulator of DNA gyrase [Nitrosococcus halophilus Nc 4]|uniref:Peptidase U62 modulator of DNA gyrase n=1 Tax=Nitrosococcus halophilus (strain Nc4) TaxID=472759 RepID=D5BUQ9_NITHN|nr:metalloprotease PmbA [Nitrosococcus halophilus]ADE13459.1 peptidase U62 modulator of DNA gyrase [Nitrosococcus halophilus Nc 4]
MSLPENQEPATLKLMAEEVLNEARALGATAAEVGIDAQTGLSVSVRLGEVETVAHHRDKRLRITLYFGHRKGSASTSDLRPAALQETVRGAASIARYTAADPCSGLAEPELMARDIPELDLCHPWGLSGEEAIAVARRCEEAGRSFDNRIVISEGAELSTRQGYRVYANSHGFLGGYASTRHSLSCVLVARTEAGMQRDYWYTRARDWREMEPAEAVGIKAARRTVARLDPRRLPTGAVPVLFAAEVASRLFAHFVAAIGGGALYRRSSFLLDHLGKQIFPSFVRLHEQPHLPKALGSAAFDNEGVATQARDIVTDGVLQGYVLGSYAARKLGMKTTGNAGGVHNLTVDPGQHDQSALLKQMNRGLLVTELMGMGVNLVTGDYSQGAAGFWVDKGEIQYPVSEITLASNLRDMFLGIGEVGTDMEMRGNIRTGSVLIDGMTVAGE